MRIPLFIAAGLSTLYLSGCGERDDSNSVLNSDAGEKNPGSTSDLASSGRQRNGRSERSEVSNILDRPGTFTGLEDRKVQQGRIAGLSKAELEFILDQTSASRNDENIETFTLAITELAKRDPREALAWFSPSEMKQLDASWAFVARAVAISDPALLKTWFRDNFDKANSSVRADGLVASLNGLGSVDPAGAFEFSKEMKVAGNPDVINGLKQLDGLGLELGGVALALLLVHGRGFW
jgi:hypothetical protein